MKVLVYNHAPPGTGTSSSSRRIADHLSFCGFTVFTHECWDSDGPSKDEIAKWDDFDVLIGTHALRSGTVFMKVTTPYVLVLSGTDVNEHVACAADFAQMDVAVRRAVAVVTYDQYHFVTAKELWPHATDKLRLIPKGVTTKPSSYSLRHALGLSEADFVLLLPSGLRAVKDVLYLVDEVENWHREDCRVRLAIVGLPREPEYVESVYDRCRASPAVTIMDPLRQGDLHAAMLDANAVVNSSRSESSANAILEAMHLGCPVIARDIPGNRALVTDRETGLLFGSPSEFRLAAQSLDGTLLGEKIGSAAHQSAVRVHSPTRERREYCRLIGNLHCG